MSIEFFRPESQRPLDANGYELPPWLNPFLSDYNAELAALPAETTESFEPSQTDVAWLNENHALLPISGGSPEPTDADWDDYARWSEWAERNDEIRRQEDAIDEICRRYAL